ncbi:MULTISPECIES: CaiB/BaiF CoA transferase family protein [Citricoccus]|uniref:CaiB/BaiF CoA transferase family protein n=1 Tax=Citricoccus TaxID=169133 RepID=UPI0002FEE31F|nr:CaiB/BaiF CoA-transferase family protein [Citricoccus sp. CH26A]
MRSNLLDGVRVLDLTNVLSGPFAGYQLALMGAEVLKVEARAGGDLARRLGASPDLSLRDLGISFLAQNSAKRSLTLDLKTERGKEVFRRLVETHDVLLENFRPGVMDRLGFGSEHLRELNPGLVYCAISGFGQNGPLRDRPAYDQIIQGMSGLMSVTGDGESAPLRVGAPIADTVGGFAAAFAISSALVRRERSGEGAFLDVSMLEATLTAMGWVASDYLVGGNTPVPMGNENRTAAPSGAFATADGDFNIAANKQEQFEALCQVIGRPELATDPRFAERETRKVNRLELKAEIEEVLTQRPSAHWDEVLAAAGIPGAPVMDVATALASPHITARGLVSTLRIEEAAGVSDPGVGADGDIRLLGAPVHVDGVAVGPDAPPPLLGQHTEDVLTGLGYTTQEIASLRTGGII